jgi:hypothetical protein
MRRLFCLIGKHRWKDELDLPTDCEARLVSHRCICTACGKRTVVKVMSTGHTFRIIYDSSRKDSVFGYEQCTKCGASREQGTARENVFTEVLRSR